MLYNGKVVVTDLFFILHQNLINKRELNKRASLINMSLMLFISFQFL